METGSQSVGAWDDGDLHQDGGNGDGDKKGQIPDILKVEYTQFAWPDSSPPSVTYKLRQAISKQTYFVMCTMGKT